MKKSMFFSAIVMLLLAVGFSVEASAQYGSRDRQYRAARSNGPVIVIQTGPARHYDRYSRYDRHRRHHHRHYRRHHAYHNHRGHGHYDNRYDSRNRGYQQGYDNHGQHGGRSGRR